MFPTIIFFVYSVYDGRLRISGKNGTNLDQRETPKSKLYRHITQILQAQKNKNQIYLY